ncbi:fumarylacetoacetate hydrolase family protein [Cohnella rhizosphaerae]|uniref:Fumarylacetoacetate hydrolase family protein n=1 Tax=Cohnella rhizosphaerae TaxID=1457232 RepID=A0A9X4KY03_9BACL|nr:fumarylacetoacetate hydrolase family protein [Cohnella rhizosphaerae]MDG0813394.1 fumarylacetoacetate hydrolase family protein [Cohnella rhizosphaerae]
MKLLHFIRDGASRLGIRVAEGAVLDVAEARGALAGDADSAVPASVGEAIEGGPEALAALRALAERAGSAITLREEELVFAPCVPKPGKIVCVGLNYRKHAEETNAPIPQSPILFSKYGNALAAHREDIPLPSAVSDQVDYEAELAIVIGRRAKDVSREEALNYVFGYCNANDLSARDLQLRTSQWLLGKTCDKFAPIGPWLVTADEVGDPNALAISCSVNGEIRQSSNTADMIFHCDEIVSYLSRHMTLEPGDLILTGTPEGVVLGYPADRQVYLQSGDIVTVEIEKLGRLTNKMV